MNHYIKKQGYLQEKDISLEEANLSYDTDGGLINYLLRYPIANVLSEYLIENDEVCDDQEIYRQCFNTNLYEVTKVFAKKYCK